MFSFNMRLLFILFLLRHSMRNNTWDTSKVTQFDSNWNIDWIKLQYNHAHFYQK